MSKKIILFPCGGNAREAFTHILLLNKINHQWDVLGFVDDNPDMLGQEVCGLKVLGNRSVFNKSPDAQVLAVPGNSHTYLERKECILNLNLKTSNFARIISSTAIISPDAKIGYNTLIMSNVFISCGVIIGNHCIILPNSVIHHESNVEDYCCIGSHVTICGGAKIKSNSYIGSGSNIRENVTIGEKSLVGLGSNVISDVEKGVVVVGNPARIL